MKKFILFMGCLALLVAGCNKEQNIEEPKQEAPRHLTFDIAVNYSDNTRAVKTEWEKNDKIYVFFDFDKSTAVEYMTMTYDGTSWSYEFSNETMEATLLKNTDGTLCAVYFPIGTPNFSISGPANGWKSLKFNLESDIQTYYRTNYSSSVNNPYTIDAEGKLTAELSMSLGTKDIQFFVPGIAETEVDNYLFSCNNMEPTYPSSIDYNISTEKYNVGYMHTTSGTQMKGYFYGDGVVFSGQLLTAADTRPFSYTFEITDTKGTEDESDDVKYTLTVSNKTLTFHDAVKLPALNSGRWTINGGNYINGHEYVDLGLSVKWATMNVGATSEKETGSYFAWGETETKDDYSSETYVYTANPTTLPSSNDVASKKWGSTWRMPTSAEISELFALETKEWVTYEGVNGYKFTGSNGKTLFLPAAGDRIASYSSPISLGRDGFYWSSSLFTDPNYASYVRFNSETVSMTGFLRYNGCTVRPVSE